MSTTTPESPAATHASSTPPPDGRHEVPAAAPSAPWHAMATGEVLSRLEVDPTCGLDPETADRRQLELGPNALAAEQRRSPWAVLLDQFRNFLIGILLVAAVVSFVVSGELKTPIVILVVVVLNAALGFLQEHRAERSLDALKKMLVVRAKVRRGGTEVELPAEQLVVGDVVRIEAGDRVPADGRLLSSTSLEVEEAALTGESAPVAKRSDSLVPPETPLGDRSNVVYMNTTVTRGRAELVVTATGMRTEIGHIAGLLRDTETEDTPLQRQLDKVGHVLAGLAGVVVLVVFAIGLLRGEPLGDLFLTAVALAVASVPEGLPAVLAVTLALGAHQMAKRNAIIKRLASVETLGCTTVICSDKTGTLTLNQMTARELWVGGARHRLGGEGYGLDGSIEPPPDASAGEVLEGLVLCNDSTVRDGELVGDPTEGALAVAAGKAGINAEVVRGERPRLAEVPFDSATKYMATFHHLEGSDRVRMWVKGAPDVLLQRSRSVCIDDEVSPLHGAPLQEVESELDRMARQGLRVLALAHRDLELAEWEACARMHDDARHRLVEGLELDALVGILDPPRSEAREAIALCHRAGIAVKMITGDHAATASAIAAELGIRGDTLTGTQLDELDDVELAARVERVGVFARVTPEHKLRLVRVLQGNGGVVAMTGDGVNDAPALKQADMGVAMGITGTEVTKEAATMVLADDNFATIVDAVRRGRTVYDNIIKFVRFQLSTTLGFGIAFLVSSAAAIAGGKPFTALQILWVNLIMDGPPAMALGVDPPAKGTMQRRPRALSEQILSPSRVTRLVFLGTIMAIGTLGVLVSAPDYVAGAAVAGTVAGTMAFTTFVCFQFFNLVNSRAEHGTAFTRDLFSNGKLWGIVGAVALLQVAVVHLPVLQSLFDTTALTLGQWLTCVAVASSVLWLEELRKLVAGHARRVAHA